jgi:uncharacterized DUF497 family protein
MEFGFEWDQSKEKLNKEKHGLDFDTASCIWDDVVIERNDPRNYGETRIVADGVVDGRVLAVVYTWRGDARRIISARRADRNEREKYYSEIEC